MTRYADLMMEHVMLQTRHVFTRAALFEVTRDLENLLSFIDGKTQDGYQEDFPKEASGNRTVSCSPPVEHGPLPNFRPISYAEGMAALATSLCSLGGSKTTLPRK